VVDGLSFLLCIRKSSGSVTHTAQAVLFISWFFRLHLQNKATWAITR